MQREIIDLTGPGMRVYYVHECAICLEGVGSNGPPLWLGCHVFCRDCIRTWGTSCPVCRTPVPEELRGRRSTRPSKSTQMFTTNGSVASSVSAHEMMRRVENMV